jgi:hypothetical protein
MGDRENIFYDKIMDGRRYLFTKDSHNWIWMHGPKDSSIETIMSNTGNKFFYTSFTSMLTNLLEKRFRAHTTRFTLGNFRKSLKTAHRDITEVAKKLDKVSWGALDRGDYCPNCTNKIKKGDE